MKTLMQGHAILTKKIIIIPLIFTLFLFQSCGKNPQNQIVKDVELSSYAQDSDIWISVSAIFKIGTMSMTSVTLPIFDPKAPGEQYGEISFKPTMSLGHNEISLALNLTKTAKINGSGEPTLPNGSPLPLGGIDEENAMVELEIAQINSKIYLALDRDTTILGFAIAIKEFDVMKDYIGGANVFLGFNIKEVLGMVGFFTGRASGQSGLGFFVDLSSVVSSDILNDIINGTAANELAGVAADSLSSSTLKSFSVASTNSVNRQTKAKSMFKSSRLSRRNKSKIYRGFQRMNSRSSKLRLIRK